MSKEEKEAILPEAKVVEAEVVEAKVTKQAPMSYLDLLTLVKHNLEIGRLDNAYRLLTEAINQLGGHQDVREPKLQNEESVEGSSSEG